MIKIQNSLTKTKETLPGPETQKNIAMYSCGVTVYDVCHIGHARSLYIFEVIRRYLQYRGYDVHFVRNITDVDDKIIQKALDLGKTFDEVIAENIKLYYQDLKSLGINPADCEPRATENIPEMIVHIEQLIDKGYAYAVEGDVYFSVRQFKTYGKLSGQSIEKMLEGVRIDAEPKKRDPLDFALWKKAKSGEPSWPSPWGEGRPGWHIECSCMSMKYLKSPTIDIHAGGRDLIFPHHENEIAQSEAVTGKPFARYWIHHGLLTINKHKMAKSLGNFITIQDVLKTHEANDLKYFFLSAHYMSNMDYSEDKIIEAHKAWHRLERFLIKELPTASVDCDKKNSFVAIHRQHFLEAMDDDFNTSKALGILFDLFNEANKHLKENSHALAMAAQLVYAQDTLKEWVREVFALELALTTDVLSSELQSLLDQRGQARMDKDYALSDQLRDQLKVQGILVEDSKEGQRWSHA